MGQLLQVRDKAINQIIYNFFLKQRRFFEYDLEYYVFKIILYLFLYFARYHVIFLSGNSITIKTIFTFHSSQIEISK